MNPEGYIAEHVRGLPRSGIRDFFAIVSEMPQAISLGIGEPDFVTPWKIRESSIFALEKGKLPTLITVGCSVCGRKSPPMWKTFWSHLRPSVRCTGNCGSIGGHRYCLAGLA